LQTLVKERGQCEEQRRRVQASLEAARAM